MPLIHIIFLGLIQGILEFFPVSSSAHLELGKKFFGMQSPALFDLSCHLGSSFAMICFFRKDLINMLTKDRKKLLYVALALFPLIPSYLLLKPVLSITKNPLLLGPFLMGTGLILLMGHKVRLKKKTGIIAQMLMIGSMQAVALVPGISRSASTISCAQALGWSAKEAVRFSFLLAIPTILGGSMIESYSLIKKGHLDQLLRLDCLIGALAAFFGGLLVIRFAINYLGQGKGKLKIFAIYCLLVGGFTSFYLI